MSRTMIVVAAGSSSRFGSDKLMEEVAGAPLVAHTVRRVAEVIDEVVLVCRPDQSERLGGFLPDVAIVAGGATRTESEMAGMAALEGERALIGVHDGARPLVTTSLIERLFDAAAIHGGAVPVIEPEKLILDRAGLMPVDGLVTVQTPQVFRGPDLLACYVRAAQTDFVGDDTLAVVHRFGDLEVAAVPGEPSNLKVTHRSDLEIVSRALGTTLRNGPR